MSAERILQNASNVVEQYNKDFGDDSISKLEKRSVWLTRQIEKLTFDALDMPKASRKPLYEKIEQFDAERSEIEIDRLKLKSQMISAIRKRYLCSMVDVVL